MAELPELVDGLPNLCGQEDAVREAAACQARLYPDVLSRCDDRVRSAFAIALHMHQPLIPGGGDDLRTAAVISNLQYMMEHQDEGDNHNAPAFQWCYKRIGEFVPELKDQGGEPRVMLDYSGTLLYGLRRMGLDDVLAALRHVTCDPHYRGCVEWLGTAWGHPVAPSTPVQDFRLHVEAWQHHFAAIYGLDALARVRGFSPPEMALPNHPDVAYSFVQTLRDCGYQYVLVQEHTVEQPNGHGVELRHLPHRLIAKNSRGETASILALVKTQGSDTKLVAQMQPYHEAKGLERWDLNGRQVPPLVTQIGDGENGGVMMNEFPDAFRRDMMAASGSETPAMNGAEYLELLFASGVQESDLPELVPLFQARLWDRVGDAVNPDAVQQAISELQQEDGRFHVEGGSWTMDRSWVDGYRGVLQPMDTLSARFAETVIEPKTPTHEARYRNALFHLLVAQTSCYRYWGEGRWTEYGRELCRRAEDVLTHDF